ncbi:MAG: hypothetical protein UX30_C0004G0010 [Candidatus Saccharibacteria bacterium GW2011_GWA2_46_10]|nr:MAG: hypothetical protein UX30_C0004G0010 [Candidatus Saccharibacteria bacterium GW2011_GWA2_46_10]
MLFSACYTKAFRIECGKTELQAFINPKIKHGIIFHLHNHIFIQYRRTCYFRGVLPDNERPLERKPKRKYLHIYYLDDNNIFYFSIRDICC